MEDLKSWINNTVKPFLAKSTEEEDYSLFLRDEPRPIIKNPRVFFSAADGVIIYNKIENNPNKKIYDVKGVPYSINEIVGSDDIITGPALICGTFMTFADIHLNRIPYSGVLSYKQIDPIKTYNMSMDFMEKDLFTDLGPHKLIPKNNKYIRNNARMLNTIYVPELDYKYYIVQTADYEVNVFQPFHQKQQVKVHQGDRFSFIRWGSQCDVILPLRDDLNIHPLIKPMMHVKAGIDKPINFM